jgi:hypothetical protein
MPDLDDLPEDLLVGQQDETERPDLNFQQPAVLKHILTPEKCYIAFLGRGNRLVGIDSVSSRGTDAKVSLGRGNPPWHKERKCNPCLRLYRT